MNLRFLRALTMGVLLTAGASATTFSGNYNYAFSVTGLGQTFEQVMITGPGTNTLQGPSNFDAQFTVNSVTDTIDGAFMFTQLSSNDEVLAEFTGAFIPGSTQALFSATGSGTLTGGTGQYSGISGVVVLNTTASFTSAAGGIGSLTVQAVPEPNIAFLLPVLGLAAAYKFRKN